VIWLRTVLFCSPLNTPFAVKTAATPNLGGVEVVVLDQPRKALFQDAMFGVPEQDMGGEETETTEFRCRGGVYFAVTLQIGKSYVLVQKNPKAIHAVLVLQVRTKPFWGGGRKPNRAWSFWTVTINLGRNPQYQGTAMAKMEFPDSGLSMTGMTCRGLSTQAYRRPSILGRGDS